MILSFLASSLAGSTPGNPRQLPGMKMYSRLNVDSTRRRRRPPFRRPYPRFSRRLGAATVIIRVASRRPRGWQCPEPGAPAVHHHAPALPNHPLAVELREVVRLFRARIVEKGLKLTVEEPAGLGIRVMGDGLRLRQLMANMLSNAVKFTDRGSVTLRLSRSEEHTSELQSPCNLVCR